MTWVLRSLGSAGPVINHPGFDSKGMYLRIYDPEAHDGMGTIEFTTDPYQAQTFRTPAAASLFINIQPKARRMRPDGLPNRPARHFHWELIRLDDASESHQDEVGQGELGRWPLGKRT